MARRGKPRRSRTRERNVPGEDELKFLLRLSKKGKGGVDMVLAERALDLIGFGVEPTLVALDLSKLSQGDWVLKGILKEWAERYRIRSIYYGDPKVWSFAFEDRQDVEGARDALDDEVVIVEAPPEDVDVGQLYFTEILPGSTSGSWPGFHVKKIWLGDIGWTLTAPSGKTVTVAAPVTRRGKPEEGPVNIATMWTFLYNNGADKAAADYLAQTPPEFIAEATATKAERARILQARSAMPEIAAVFREVTEQQYQEVIKFLEELFISSMEIVLEKQEEGKRIEWHKIAAGGEVQRIMHTVRGLRGHMWEPLPDYKVLAHQEAVRAADEAREDFVHKNTARISEIAKRKGSIPVATITSLTGGGRGDYGGEILFEFEDGSRFDLRNKTVWKRSPLGRVFAQFPTTFHNVVLPGGKKMAQPSEARMLDVFAARLDDDDALARKLARGEV